MLDLNKTRIIEEAEYIIENNSTVRQCACVFGVGKSTVHSDVAKKLKYIDNELYEKVAVVLKKNLDERHLRGGESTKLHYSKKCAKSKYISKKPR